MFTGISVNRLKRFREDLFAALSYPYRSLQRALLAVALAILTFGVLILASQPLASYQMFIVDIFNYPTITAYFHAIEQVLLMNFQVTLIEYGWDAIAMNAVYAVLTGIALVNMIAQLRMLQVGSLANIGGILPGLFAAGCASCGPGLFALLGFTGAVTFVPFQDTVLRIAGIILFLFFLGLSGDPRNCRIA
ncbi:hypothetical protein [Halocatena pleomorpha]|nr:hypothetical protein [Halocatena pleomorpha]